MAREAPVVFARWETFLHWLFAQTEKFPRRLRASLTVRVENVTLDVFESLVEARYARNPTAYLRIINQRLETLRLLLRIAHTQRVISTKSFTFACESVDEVGRMVGGWLKQAGGRGGLAS